LRRAREGGNRPGTRERVTTRDIIQSSATVRPTRAALEPQPLGRGEAGRLGETPPRAARGAALEQGTAQQPSGTPSARQQRREQRQATSPQRGRETEQPQVNIRSPVGTSAQAPARPRQGTVERRADRGERNQQPSAVERRPSGQTPVARPPSGNQGIVQRAPTSRPPVNRPTAVAAPPRPPAAPPRTVAAPPRPAPPPHAAAAPPPRPAPPPVTTGAAPRGGSRHERPAG
jgi:hypothetical protein